MFFEIIKKTPAEWTAANPILLDNEIGVEEDVRNNANTVPAKAKMGDNVTRWNDLEYWNPPGVADVPWTSASASSSASLAFAEDTDNGAHAVTLKAPAAVTADVDVTLPDAACTLGYLNIPQQSFSAAYPIVLADSGKHLYHPVGDANARQVTIPANGSVPFELGTAITIVNDSPNDVTVVITTDVLTYADVGVITTLTIPQYNQATILKVTTTQWNASGTAGCTTA